MTPDNHTCAIGEQWSNCADAERREPVEPVLSCSCEAALDKVKDTCCTETYGGLLVATQLWSTFTGLESHGQLYPKHAWGIHGLWPDFCNGSYTQYCDLSRQGEPIDQWFGPYGKLDLLAYMNRYWVSQSDPNWVFWAHEFSKHATCYSTFQAECYGPKAAQHSDLFDFFETVITWQRRLPTFRWLADAGIRPSNSTGYTVSEVQAALTERFNETEAGRGSADNGRTVLNEVWYYYHVRGTPQRAEGRKLDAAAAGGRLTTCATAEGAVKYYERTEGSEN
ncbi:hypothetical protein UVI_02019730 [Ustilaginoidea virens]|uniref:ribonuclease T2 n=1 Tax=Ustilaginoidea virens TaxID=1159556 RepID=A0A1B5KZP7_USTVR|nr:hypothetical protein UVI_02019730 [Ustilaginoidea virens]